MTTEAPSSGRDVTWTSPPAARTCSRIPRTPKWPSRAAAVSRFRSKPRPSSATLLAQRLRLYVAPGGPPRRGRRLRASATCPSTSPSAGGRPDPIEHPPGRLRSSTRSCARSSRPPVRSGSPRYVYFQRRSVRWCRSRSHPGRRGDRHDPVADGEFRRSSQRLVILGQTVVAASLVRA
jgi:hypothetical protein